jgi:hypothetical protein
MTIPIPALDDRTFDELVREALARLPAYAPEWTNHNPSDPGITLVELFAYFTEILLYRMGRIPPASKRQFLRLLTGGTGPGEGAGAGDIAHAISDAVRELSQLDCATTAGDFERHAERAARAHLHDLPVRVLCIPGADLERGRTDGARAGKAHVSVVIVPERALSGDALAKLCEAVRRDLLPRCLLGTRLHVRGPIYLRVGIGVALAARPGMQGEALLRDVAAALSRRFGYATSPDADAHAALLGRPLYLSEIIATIDQVDGVDYVADVTIMQLGTGPGPLDNPRNSVGIQIGTRSTLGRDSRLGGSAQRIGERLLRDDAGRLLGIMGQPWELLDLVLMHGAFEPGGVRGG